MTDDADEAPGVKNTTPTDGRPPGILYWSTPESAAEGRITVLACIETVLAVSVTTYIAWTTRSLLFIAVPACIAPLLLLRTPYSTEVGLKLWGRYEAWAVWVDKWDDRMREARRLEWAVSALATVVLGLLASLAGLACRTVAVGTAMLRHPLTGFGAIPGNWRRVALATDLHHSPEIVPGMEENDVESAFRIAPWISQFGLQAKPQHGFARIVRFILATPAWISVITFAVVWFVPALLYRWSLKSTTVVYFPLLWAAFKSRRGGDTAAQRLETITTDPTERLLRWYAGFVLILLTLLPFVLAAPLQPIIAPVQNAFGIDVVDFWLFTGHIGGVLFLVEIHDERLHV